MGTLTALRRLLRPLALAAILSCSSITAAAQGDDALTDPSARRAYLVAGIWNGNWITANRAVRELAASYPQDKDVSAAISASLVYPGLLPPAAEPMRAIVSNSANYGDDGATVALNMEFCEYSPSLMLLARLYATDLTPTGMTAHPMGTTHPSVATGPAQAGKSPNAWLILALSERLTRTPEPEIRAALASTLVCLGEDSPGVREIVVEALGDPCLRFEVFSIAAYSGSPRLIAVPGIVPAICSGITDESMDIASLSWLCALRLSGDARSEAIGPLNTTFRRFMESDPSADEGRQRILLGLILAEMDSPRRGAILRESLGATPAPSLNYRNDPGFSIFSDILFPPQSRAEVLKMLSDPDPTRKKGALWVLNLFEGPSEEIAAPILRIAQDPNEDIEAREYAAEALAMTLPVSQVGKIRELLARKELQEAEKTGVRYKLENALQTILMGMPDK